MKEILFLGPVHWDFLWQRSQILAFLFHRAGWRTVYLESTGIANPTLKDVFRIALRRFAGIERLKNPRPRGLDIIDPLILPPTFKLFRLVNRKIFIPRVVANLRSIGLSRPVIVANLPTETTLRIIDEVPHRLLVYDCSDKYEAFPRAAKEIPRWEEELASRSHIITASSPFLYERLRQSFPDKTYPFYNGVDYALFSKAFTGVVREVRSLCFYGTVSQRMDFELLWGAASLLPEVKFYLVGLLKVKPPSPPDNVRFFPPMAPEKLVDFLRDCDALVIPYKKSDLIEGVFPAKFFESLATGKPLIVSGIEENIRDYLDLVYPASTPGRIKEVVKRIPELETEEKVKARMRVAEENSWERRFETLVSLIERAEGSNFSPLPHGARS